MHIAIIVPNLAGGGVERVRLLLASEFLAIGHTVDLVLLEARGDLLSEVPNACNVVDLDAHRLRQGPIAIHRYLRQKRPDLVLASIWPLTGLVALAARTSGSKATLILSEHTDFRHAKDFSKLDRILLRCFGRAAYRQAAAIVAVSQGVAASVAFLTGIEQESICVVPNPVRAPRNEAAQGTDEELLAWWSQGSRILAVGSLKEQKGFDVLVAAMDEITPSVEARLIILGEGSLRTALEAEIKKRKLENHVRLPGFRANPYPFFERANVFVLSSRWEGLGNVITEALSAGIPVVSTDCPSGPSELLEGGRFGRLVAVDDAHALATGILATLDEKHDPYELKRRAAEFTAPMIAARYLDLAKPLHSAPGSRPIRLRGRTKTSR